MFWIVFFGLIAFGALIGYISDSIDKAKEENKQNKKKILEILSIIFIAPPMALLSVNLLATNNPFAIFMGGFFFCLIIGAIYELFSKNNTIKTNKNIDKSKIFFDDNISAFYYSCSHSDTKPKRGIIFPAIVVSTRPMDSSGIQWFTLKVSSKDNGFKVISRINTDKEFLFVGDFVSWKFLTVSEYIVISEGEDERFSSVGFVVSKLDKIYDKNAGWVIQEDLSHLNIEIFSS